MIDYNSPGEDVEYHITASGSINLSQYFKCFSNANIPDAGASYSVTISAALPNVNNPYQLIGKGLHPGHAFITMTKSNGGQTVSQTFGFYPINGRVSILMGEVASKVVDDGASGFEHKTHASLVLNGLTGSQFSMLQATSLRLASRNYDLNNFNCTDFALAIFNSVSSSSLIVPDWEIWPFNYGRTPNGLYKTLVSMSANPNVYIATTTAATSHGPCY